MVIDMKQDYGLSLDGTYSINQKIDIINSNKVDIELLEYLKEAYKNLKIEILGDYKGNLLELMNKGLLEGWCFETSQTAILFLNDKSYIKRGYLNLQKDKKYYHSWLELNYNEKNYVFDPCLNILVDKKIYDELFEVDILSTIPSNIVKEFVFNYIKEHKNDKKKESSISNYLKRMFPESYERIKDEIIINPTEDITSPIYRGSVGYKANIEDDKLLSLTAHYYLTA